MLEKLKSRKLWAALITSVLLILNNHLAIFDDATAAKVVAVVVSYLFGQAAVDFAKEK